MFKRFEKYLNEAEWLKSKLIQRMFYIVNYVDAMKSSSCLLKFEMEVHIQYRKG